MGAGVLMIVSCTLKKVGTVSSTNSIECIIDSRVSPGNPQINETNVTMSCPFSRAIPHSYFSRVADLFMYFKTRLSPDSIPEKHPDTPALFHQVESLLVRVGNTGRTVQLGSEICS